MTTATRPQLLSRSGCHLCDEMAHFLRELGVAFDLVDVDEDAALSAAFGDAIPVLMQGGVEIARAPQSSRTLERTLRRCGVL